MDLLIPLLVIAVVVLFIAAKTIRIVPQAAVLLSRGWKIRPRREQRTQYRYSLCRSASNRLLGGSRVTQIDLREQFTDLAPQPVITRDNVTIMVDSIIYWQITDPIKAMYEVNDSLAASFS
jgi:regulator of protease activity HflC (stomatin/prohibitin superfamily)